MESSSDADVEDDKIKLDQSPDGTDPLCKLYEDLVFKRHVDE